MLEICLYLSNLKTYEHVVYLSMKHKDWSTKWDIHFEHRWRNSNINQLKLMLEICLYLSILNKYEDVVYLSMKHKDWSTNWDIYYESKWRKFRSPYSHEES